MMLKGKRLGMLIVVGFMSLFLFNSVFAQVTTTTAGTGVVIDERCAREKVTAPSGEYAKECNIEGNLESSLICSSYKYPENKGFFGALDLFKTRLRITPETLPYVIRTVITVAFSVLGVSALWLTIWGYYKWTIALNDSPDDAAKVWKLFTNGMFGLLFSLASLALTWGVFYAAGVRQSSESFFAVGDEFTKYLSFPCEDLSDADCKQYDYSCKFITSNCEPNPEAEKALIISTKRGLPECKYVKPVTK